jgi:hypothetical protein
MELEHNAGQPSDEKGEQILVTAPTGEQTEAKYTETDATVQTDDKGGASTGVKALLDLGTQSTAAPRPSIAALEPSFKKRKFILGIYIGLTFLVATLTSLKFFRSVGLIPDLPEATPVVESTSEFYVTVNGTATTIAVELDEVYLDSLMNQESLCLSSLELAYSEQERIANQSQDFADLYCQDLANRTFVALRERGLLDGTTDRCLLAPNGGLDGQISWAYRTSSGLINYFGAIEMLNPTLEGCFEPNERGPNYEFDNIFLLPSLINAPASERCLAQRNRMQNDYATNSENQVIGFAESLAARLAYDQEYFFGSQEAFFDINADVRAIELGPFPRIQADLEAFRARIEVNVGYMGAIFNAWQNLYATIPIGPNIPAPDLSVPDLPEVDLSALTNLLDGIQLTTSYFEDYNPPEVQTADAEVSFSSPSLEFELPQVNLNLASSTILRNMQETFESLALFLATFENVDFFVRICFWLREVAVVFKVQRRDFSSLKSKGKKAVSFIFANSNIFLFLGLMLWGVIYIAQLQFSFDFVEEELFVVCNNNVVTNNAETLADYTSEVSRARASCDASISLENNRSRTAYDELYGPMETIATEYEIRYRAIDNGATVEVDGIGPVPVIQEFEIDTFAGVEEPIVVPPLPLTPLEQFEVSAMGQCANGTEAREVRNQTEDYTANLVRYVTGFLLVTLVLNASAKAWMWSFRQVWWLDLTEGYTADTIITSKDVKARVKSKRRNAVIISTIALAMSIVVISLSYGRVFG